MTPKQFGVYFSEKYFIFFLTLNKKLFMFTSTKKRIMKMELKERILKFYKSQRACQRVLRVRTPQQFNNALRDDTAQTGLRKRIENHIAKLEGKK